MFLDASTTAKQQIGTLSNTTRSLPKYFRIVYFVATELAGRCLISHLVNVNVYKLRDSISGTH